MWVGWRRKLCPSGKSSFILHIIVNWCRRNRNHALVIIICHCKGKSIWAGNYCRISSKWQIRPFKPLTAGAAYIRVFIFYPAAIKAVGYSDHQMRAGGRAGGRAGARAGG